MTTRKLAIYSGEIPSTTFIERLINGLSRSGNKVYLIGKKNKRVKYSKSIIVSSYSGKWSKLFYLIKYTFLLLIIKPKEKKKLDKIIHEKNKNKLNYKLKYYPVLFYKPDIFHLQWAKSIKDWIWLQDFGIKLVVSLRGTHVTISPLNDESLKLDYIECFPKVDGFHAVSNSMKKEAIKYGADLEKIKIIYSGLNLSDLPFTTQNLENKTFKILSIGRSHWVKGYQEALDACAILKEGQFKFEYTIVGIDNNEELLFQRAQLHLKKEVHFQKSLSFKEIIIAIQNADVLLLPSLEEGIANVVLEAMALGTIVLSTNCGGMKEVIEDNKNGFLVPLRNPLAIANTVKSVSKLSKEAKEQILKNARKTIEKQHCIISSINEMNNLYESIISKF